ncbi:YceD family protein [Ferrovibrio sp.]|uniref:YceD family protein n=1 Tax=Ferrovibrio sp. TaxID=1917215 RepID=UPI003D09FBF7
MAQAPIRNEFTHPLEVAQLGPEGVSLRLTAGESERRALAQRFGILGILKLEAEIRVLPLAEAGHYHLSGRLEAEVEQACVVSLEPVREVVSEAFERGFAPPEAVAAALAALPELTEDEAELLDPDAQDPPDPIEAGVIDLGEVVAEELALSLNPYPRKEGASWPAGYSPDPEPEAKVSPFAALAKLKQGTEK